MAQKNLQTSSPEPFKNLDITTLNLSTRTRRKLLNLDGAKLLNMSEEQLKNKFKLSDRSIAELREELTKKNLSLQV